MDIIKLDDTDRNALISRLAETLKEGGLVCLPCNGSYRIVADLRNPDAVQELMQSKSRTKTAPALIFVDTTERLAELTDDLHPMARRLADALWPGPLTIRVKLHDQWPKKIIKHLGGKKAQVGVRVPEDDLVRAVVRKVGGPLLVSSANRQKKSGDSSPAQVRKTFAARVDIFVDSGDIHKDTVSTVIDIVKGELSVVRTGNIDEQTLRAALGS